MFQFTRFAAKYLCIQYPLVQESRDQRLFVNYPGLIADLHALHRLLMPRHPPYTLSSLTTNIQPSIEPAENRPNERRINYLHCQPQYPVNDISLLFNLSTC